MNNKGLSFMAGLTLVTLVACSSGAPPPGQPSPNEALFIPANAWLDAVPAGATKLTPEDFSARIAAGELVLTSSASVLANAAGRAKHYQDDLAFLHTVTNPTPELTALLAQAAIPGDTSDRPVKTTGGQQVLLFGLDTQVRNAAEAYRSANSVENALTDYAQTYSLLPSDLQALAPTPAGLNGKSLEAVRAALSGLNSLLKTRPAVLRVARLESPGGAGLRSQGLNAGNGSDNNGPCTPTNLVKRYWFPLKNFVSPVKNQGSRGTCWAFSAIGALESREQVQNNNPANLSEQFLVNKVKQDWDSSDYTDGYSATKALNTALSKGQVFPSEGSWTYNGATTRATVKDGDKGSYAGACAGYTGMCSDTAHQSGESCTTFILSFCGYVKVTYGGAGVASSATTQVWNGNQVFDLERYRLLLARGHVLIATFPVYRGFMDDVKSDGVVSNYSTTMIDTKGKEVNGAYGRHAVQIVGFLSNDDLASFGTPAAIAGGGYFIIKNSWGCGSGDGGYYYVPADYVSRLFDSLSTLVFDTQRSEAWNREQATPGGTDAPGIEIKANPGRVDLRVETDLALLFRVTHPVAKSVSLTVTSDRDGQLYDGPWDTDQALFSPSLKVTFATAGPRRLHLLAKYGTSEAVGTLNVDAVNSPPYLRLLSSGSPYQGEPYSVTALIQDLNEPDARSLCANAVWSVDGPDTLASATGCSQVIRFGTTGSRQVRVSTHDSEGAVGSDYLFLNVLPPPANPYPRLLGAGVYSLEYVLASGSALRFCDSLAVTGGATINLTESGCSAGIRPVPAQRYLAQAKIENPTQEILTYDWNLYVTRDSEILLYSAIQSTNPDFKLHDYGNEGLVTSDCRVTLKINAPDPSRSKGPVTVWTGRCTYHATILK